MLSVLVNFWGVLNFYFSLGFYILRVFSKTKQNRKKKQKENNKKQQQHGRESHFDLS